MGDGLAGRALRCHGNTWSQLFECSLTKRHSSNTTRYYKVPFHLIIFNASLEEVQVGNDQENAQSEKKISTPETEVGKKTNKQSGTFTMKTHRKPNEQSGG